MQLLCSLLALSSLCWCLSTSQYAPDLITSFPGLADLPNFKEWSGYLQAGSDKYVHYWFMESQGNPESVPLVLWLNGGPGCSSMEGLLAENGPYRINDDGSLYMNPHCWNLVANVLYLELPAGVGYSYSSSQNYKINDQQVVVADNCQALPNYLMFFTKFPSFTSNDFYGRVYVPSVSAQIVNGPASINFEILEAYRMIQGVGLNVYNLHSPYWGTGYQERYTADMSNLYHKYQFSVAVPPPGVPIPGIPRCINATAMYVWLNQDNVRQAARIPVFLPNWEPCSTQVTSQYQRQYMDMAPFCQELLQSNIRVLVYNGDTDMPCNFLGAEKFVEFLNQPVMTLYQPWYYKRQVAGFFKEYEQITFLTVKGPGLMVPHYRPAQALKMFESVLRNTTYL